MKMNIFTNHYRGICSNGSSKLYEKVDNLC